MNDEIKDYIKRTNEQAEKQGLPIAVANTEKQKVVSRANDNCKNLIFVIFIAIFLLELGGLLWLVYDGRMRDIYELAIEPQVNVEGDTNNYDISPNIENDYEFNPNYTIEINNYVEVCEGG